jgi:hypothetical protein
MATYTPNYNLNKPTFAELADVRTFNGNMDIIDTVMNASQNSIAEPYDSTKTYNEGDMVMYELYLYRCLEETTGTWDATKWERAHSASSGAGITYPQDATKYLNGVGQWTVPAGGGDYFSPVIYSTEEREIGVWVDNKPLYQKSYLNIGTVTSYTFTDLTDIESIRIVEGASECNDGIPFQYVHPNTANIVGGFFDLTGTNPVLEIRRGGEASGTSLEVLTVQYTKTTDTAGSGSYNTLGVPTVHYSTDEQVIGTWIDGSTLYQRTYLLNDILVASGGAWVDLNIDISNVSVLVDGKFGQDVAVWNVLSAINDNGALKVTNTGSGDLTISRVTIQYTKVTV